AKAGVGQGSGHCLWHKAFGFTLMDAVALLKAGVALRPLQRLHDVASLHTRVVNQAQRQRKIRIAPMDLLCELKGLLAGDHVLGEHNFGFGKDRHYDTPSAGSGSIGSGETKSSMSAFACRRQAPPNNFGKIFEHAPSTASAAAVSWSAAVVPKLTAEIVAV